MHVLSYSAHNVMRLSDIDFNLAGRNLFLVGGTNGQGKTSALTALLMALCGRSGMDYPEVSLKEGETKGWVKVHLSGDEELHEPDGLTVELFLRRKRNGQVVEEFRILDSAGEPAPEPRTLLKRLYSTRAFDPLSFEKQDRRKKAEILNELLGLDFTAEKKQRKKLYDERTAVNRDVKNLEAKLGGLDRYDDLPDELSTEDLLAELERLQEVNRERSSKRKEFTGLMERRGELEQAVEEKDAEIARQEALLSKLKSDRDSIAGMVRTSTRKINAFDPVPDDEDLAPVRQKIKDASAVQEKVMANRLHADAVAALTKAESEASDLTARIEALDASMAQAIAAAPWPIEGLSCDEDGVLYNGLPFEQASKSQRVLASVAIGMALNPKLRLLVCQDGNDLDQTSLLALEQTLRENDFQMIVEMVTRGSDDEDRCAVVIKEGAVAPKLSSEDAELAA